MKNFRKNIIWILSFTFVWILISIYVYVCTIRGFCQKNIKHEENNIKVEQVDDTDFNDEKEDFFDDSLVLENKEDSDDLVKNISEEKTVTESERIIKCFTYLNSSITKDSNRNIKSEVIRLEKFFNEFYSKNLNEDGIYGENDILAVKEFQGDNNLYVDGAVGPQTQRIINAVYCVKTEKR